MTPAKLRAIGKALYGPDFHAPLAASLGVAPRTMQRWASGARPIPELEPELKALCLKRSRELAALARKLDALEPIQGEGRQWASWSDWRRLNQDE